MIFTLEALDAGRGDCLLVHWARGAGRPRLLLIDGGLSATWRTRLRPRLEELRARRSPDKPLELRLAMVSHIDDDHIAGLLGMAEELDAARAGGREQLWDVLGLWHNSFADVAGSQADAARIAALIARGAGRASGAVAASVNQGRRLRDLAASLAWEVNRPFAGAVRVHGAAKPVALGGYLQARIVAPSQARLDTLRRDWQRHAAAKPTAETVAYLDRSVFNLSSIVVELRLGTKRMLLTGDARGDDVLAGLEEAKLMKPGGVYRCSLLKVPHHGSARNVAEDFFRRVVADHYVISADGTHGNPDTEMLEMLAAARTDDTFTVHLTNAVKEAVEFWERQTAQGRRWKLVVRRTTQGALAVDLAGHFEQ